VTEKITVTGETRIAAHIGVKETAPVTDMATRQTAAGPEAAFASVAEVETKLREHNYLPDRRIASAVFLADQLGKPILVEGPAGTGKTELARTTAEILGAKFIRLQCYEGLDEGKVLYEWDYRKQLLRIQVGRAAPEAEGGTQWETVEEDIFSEEFLLARPLLQAIRSTEPVVLLIDEIDRIDIETEALLLEVLSEFQISIPELGTVTATRRPHVFLTSNNTRELSEALKRRCLYLHIDYPSIEREREIVLARVPGISEALAEKLTTIIRSLRLLDLKKKPSISETLDWAHTLLLLGKDNVDTEFIADTLNVLLKHQTDIEIALAEIVGSGPNGMTGRK
jgi:MoxR-like ATPase